MDRRLLLVAALALPVVGCGSGCSSNESCTSVLFIGNSYTSANDLPTMFADLAASGGHHVDTGVDAPGAATLAEHEASSTTASLIKSKHWSYVVIQEQSQIPALAYTRQHEMYPSGDALIAQARADGAKPLLFSTWTRRDGWPENGITGYAAMQGAVDAGYAGLSGRDHVPVAPVGKAWAALLAQSSDAGLWESDGSHPTEKGTYLAACVVYATIFVQSPVGLSFHAGLSDADATQVQRAASDAVFPG